MDLYATSIVNLHITEDEFWKSTPAKIYSLLKQVQYNREFLQYQVGIIASTIHNTVTAIVGAKVEFQDPAMYVPRLANLPKPAEPELTEDAKLSSSLQYIKTLTELFGGIDLRGMDTN